MPIFNFSTTTSNGAIYDGKEDSDTKNYNDKVDNGEFSILSDTRRTDGKFSIFVSPKYTLETTYSNWNSTDNWFSSSEISYTGSSSLLKVYDSPHSYSSWEGLIVFKDPGSGTTGSSAEGWYTNKKKLTIHVESL